MKIGVSFSQSLKKALDKTEQRLAKEFTEAVRQETTALKAELRGQVTADGLGRRLPRTWRDEVYPRRGEASIGPAGVVYSRAPKLISAFDKGATIRSRDGFFMAVPTDLAPKRGVGGKRLTPSNFPEHRFGALRFVYRAGRPALLVVDAVRISKAGRVTRQAKNRGILKSGRLASGVTTVPMFTLVPQVKLRKRLDIEGAARRAERRLMRRVAQAINTAGRAPAARAR